MTQVERDALVLRCEAIDQRTSHIERRLDDMTRAQMFATAVACVLAGLVFAAIIVGAFELRAIHHLVEAQQWRSR